MDIIDENGDLLDFYVFLYSWKISWFSLEDWWHALQIIEELDKSEETVVNILEGSKRPRESAQTKEFKAERDAQKKNLHWESWTSKCNGWWYWCGMDRFMGKIGTISAKTGWEKVSDYLDYYRWRRKYWNLSEKIKMEKVNKS